MDCNGNATNGGRVGDDREREGEVASNIGRVSSVEDLEFGTGIPKELLQGPGPEFPESDQALLNNVAGRFVLELFKDSAEAVELGQVSPQDSHGLFAGNGLPDAVEGNGISGPNVELGPIEDTATKSNGFSATELLASLENQISIGENTVSMVKSILKPSMSTRVRPLYFLPCFCRGGRGLSQILKGNKTMEAFDCKDIGRVIQPRRPWTGNWLKFRADNFTRMRNQLRMSPSWAKPTPLELGPSAKVKPPAAGAGLILEHEEVHESAAVESQETSSQVPMGERTLSKQEALLNPEILARVRLMLRKPIPDSWVGFARGRHIIRMPKERFEWEDAYVKFILSSIPKGDKGKSGPQDAATEGQGIAPAMKPPNGMESESNASSPYDLRSGNLKSKYESASDCSVDKTHENDSRKTPNTSKVSALESDIEKITTLPALNQMEGSSKEDRKAKGNFFQKIGQRLHSRRSEIISTVSSEDFAGEVEAAADIYVAKKSEQEEGKVSATGRKLEWFETPVPSDLNLDYPIHRPLLPVFKPRTRLQRFLDFMLCRREPKVMELGDHLEILQRNHRELDKFLQKKAKKDAQRKAKREAKASK